MKRDLIILSVIITSILIIGSVLIATESLPEQKAKDFDVLSNVTIKQDVRIVEHEIFDDNIFAYAINNAAEEAIYIALEDSRVKEILDTFEGLEITISGIQPVVMIDDNNNEMHNGIGEVIITVNWQMIDGKLDRVERFEVLDGKNGIAHQKLYTIIIDINNRKIIDMMQQDRVVEKKIEKDVIYMDMNLYMPRSVIIEKGSTIEWVNTSHLPHNVLGTYKTDTEEIIIDSKFLDYNGRWKYTFNERGIFEYGCSIHLEDGMKGVIIVE